jgi:hypothetical protein
MTFHGGEWRMWRNEPEFAQRFIATVSGDGDAITGAWSKRVSGGAWGHDFEVRYKRASGGGNARATDPATADP